MSEELGQAGASGGPEARRRSVTACVLMIGDEILSGRTRDANLSHIAKQLNEVGIQVREARVIPDIEDKIVAVLNEARADYDYVFTTGGIGPTHDDITADSVAKAFGVGIDYNPEAMELLSAHYKETGGEFTEARMRMARIPFGATLIANPVSKAPGFQMGNVFVLAGVPMVMQVMLDNLMDRLEGGAKMLSRTVSAAVGEGQLAAPLKELQGRFPEVNLGSYPYFRERQFGVSLVARGTDSELLDRIEGELKAMIRALGAEPMDEPPAPAGAAANRPLGASAD